MGAFPLLGIDKDAWDIKNESDLIAIKPRNAPDVFSKWFTEYLVPLYHHTFGKRFKVCRSLLSGKSILIMNRKRHCLKQ
jgi:hypothetical protein